MNFILIALLMFQKSLLHHALPELQHRCRAETMERRDGPVSRDSMGDRPPRHSEAMFGGDSAGGLLLRMAQVVEAERSGDEARGILDALQSA